MTSTPANSIVVGAVETPVGALRVAERRGRVVALAFADHFDRVTRPLRQRCDVPWIDGEPDALDALTRYLEGELGALGDLDIDVEGTDFRRRVWSALRAIPPGRTATYGDIARAVGSPGAVRAVGSANGANPVWLVVPCHRVVRSDGGVGGYGGGTDRKAWLLRHEGALAALTA